MKTWIKSSIAAAVIATGALGTTAALAWGGQCDGGGPRGGKAGWSKMAPEQMKAKMAQRADLHLARLELALALTPEQKPVFETFKADMKARGERMAAVMTERRATELADTRKSVERFYATLNDPQKTVFDAEFPAFVGKGMRDGMRGGPRDGGGPRMGQDRG